MTENQVVNYISAFCVHCYAQAKGKRPARVMHSFRQLS
jgi:hypothetical protein